MIRRAHAKINLHLDVGPRRADGYHSLRTVFQEISLHDTLRVARVRTEIAFTCSDEKLAGPDNLIVRALQLLRTELNVVSGARVHLIKRIPVGAGLGGGSSDAAAALMAGLELWAPPALLRNKKKCAELLFPIAKKLGADVPFFLLGGTAKASGIGDELTPLEPQPKRWMVLVYPRVHVATPLAYQLLDRSRSPFAKAMGDGGKSTDFFNSFEPVIFKKFPAVSSVRNALIEAGCFDVLMSGSGSSVFGFVKSAVQARKIKASLSRRHWDIFAVHTL